MRSKKNLIESIYDCAINSHLWNETLDLCVDSVGCRSATLHIVEMQLNSPYKIGAASSVFTQQRTGILLEKYVSEFSSYENELCEFIMSREPGLVFEDSEIYPDFRNVRQRPDYAFAEKYFGIYRRAGARLNDNLNWYDMVAFQFESTHTVIPTRCKSKIGELIPHLAKSAEISRLFQELQSKYKATLGAIENLEAGMSACLRDGSIVVKNTAMDRILNEKDGISTGRKGELTLLDSDMARSFSHAIAYSADTVQGKANESEFLFLVERPSLKPPYVLEITPLKDSSGEIETNLNGASVIVIDPTVEYSYSIEKIKKAYRLSVAECEVLKLLLAGKTNVEIAEHRDVRPDTVKEQINNVKIKTMTKNRFELIRLASKTAAFIKS